MNRFRAYYLLTKPGIIYGNVMTTMAGFILAASIKHAFSVSGFLGVTIGTGLVIACGCVANNYIDRGIDGHMKRTKKRPSVTGLISLKNAVIYAVILGGLGFSILGYYTNLVTTSLGVTGLFFYLVMYSIYKRRSVWGTVVGSVSGATPLAAGYTAVSGRLDSGAVILFLIMVCWQMPHFYAIAMFRLKDYRAANIPVLPAKAGMHHTKLQILAYVAAFTASASMLTVLGYTGYVFLAGVSLLGVLWFWKGVTGFRLVNDVAWARGMFFFSLTVLMALSGLIALGAVLP
jgi:protoheme IX farnesyltransferase